MKRNFGTINSGARNKAKIIIFDVSSHYNQTNVSKIYDSDVSITKFMTRVWSLAGVDLG